MASVHDFATTVALSRMLLSGKISPAIERDREREKKRISIDKKNLLKDNGNMFFF